MVFQSHKESRKESLRARWDCTYVVLHVLFGLI